MTTMSITVYAIHDPWFHGLPDGDVDDRAGFCAYEKYLLDNPGCRIIVYVGDRYEETMYHYGDTRIEFRNTFDFQEIALAQKIIVCAPVKEASDRLHLTNIISQFGNGYSQGCKIGCMNFPNANYEPLLESIAHRYSTVDTMLTFPTAFVQRLDPIYWKDYQEYSILKLISPGAIVHIPGLLYRLYCPGLGGGPGTNMLAIQKLLQTHFDILDHIPVDKDHFVEFNQALIQKKNLVPTAALQRLPHVMENQHLLESMLVMIYFANLIYRLSDRKLYEDDTDLYSLQSIPKGKLWINPEDMTETPPLYDLVAVHAMLYDTPLPTRQELEAFY